MIKKPLLGTTGRQWLKSVHLILSVIWLGAAISMNILRFAWAPSGNGDLYTEKYRHCSIMTEAKMPPIASRRVW